MIADTNLFIAHLRGVPEATEFLRRNADLYVPFVVAAELLTGELLSRRSASADTRMSNLLDVFPTLWPDADTLSHFAQLRVHLRRAGTPIDVHDAWIAALALEFELPVVTSDVDFERVPDLKIVSWATA